MILLGACLVASRLERDKENILALVSRVPDARKNLRCRRELHHLFSFGRLEARSVLAAFHVPDLSVEVYDGRIHEDDLRLLVLADPIDEPGDIVVCDDVVAFGISLVREMKFDFVLFRIKYLPGKFGNLLRGLPFGANREIQVSTNVGDRSAADNVNKLFHDVSFQ
jgi:hypothetical protein